MKKELIVEEIQKGDKLEQANEVDIHFFFNKRMQNKPRKANVGTWEILYKDNDWIYFGYPKFSSIFSPTRLIESLFKVSRSELDNKFPEYENIQGMQVRMKLYDAIFKYKKKNLEDTNHIIVDYNFIPKLDNNQIQLSIDLPLNQQGKVSKNEKFIVILKRTDLELISIRKY
jgi:hypothetical protein